MTVEREYNQLELVGSATDIIPVVADPAEFNRGPCRGLLIEGSGTLDVVTMDGTTVAGIPVPAGILPIRVRAVTAFTVTSVWALY